MRALLLPQCHFCIKSCMNVSICNIWQNNNKGIRSTLSWPPTSQTVKPTFLYSTVSTLNPTQNTQIWESVKFFKASLPLNFPNVIQVCWLLNIWIFNLIHQTWFYRLVIANKGINTFLSKIRMEKKVPSRLR